MRDLTPVNRHLLIVPHTKKNETPSGVVLPDDYTPEQDLYVEATVLALSKDCNKEITNLGSNETIIDKKIIVDSSMIREINVGQETFHLILENYVVGVMSQKRTS